MTTPLSLPTAWAAPAVDDFTPVTPIANPTTPDQQFFNFRLQYFLPETEPLIKQTFGSTLKFDDAAFWEYSSYYSRAVSFATNLPTLAMIEYGPDDNYGTSTQQTESYFYQHTLYLTGLTPGQTYHYRIKVKGSDGAFLASDDHVFTTPTLPSSVIRIPQDFPGQTPPYKLTQDNATYLLTQDLTADNGGIVIDANNVVLDLGGNTISYDNAPNPDFNSTTTRSDLMYGLNFTFGVRSGLWNEVNQKIFNGTIVQGSNGGAGINGTGYNPIYSIQTTGMEIGGITADYYGDNINGIDVSVNVNIHNNVVYDRGTGIDARDLAMRAITTYDQADRSQNVTAYNSVRRCRQIGISAGGLQIGNEVYDDSYATNSFLLSYASDSISENNKLFGLGYMPIGIGGGNMTNAVARNNFIYVNAYAPDQRFDEYGRTSGAVGFRPQIYPPAGGLYENNVFENNVVVGKAWPGAAYVRALWVASDTDQVGMVVSNNTVKVETMTDQIDTTDGDYSFSCIEFQGWDWNPNAPVVMFTGNTLITNLTFIAFGSGYGIGSNGAFYNTTFEKITTNAEYYQPLRIGYWDWDSVNNKIIDSTTGPGVDLTAPPVNISYSEPNLLTLDIGFTSDRIYADAGTGSPLGNAIVEWQTDGGDFGVFTTGASGEAQNEWITTHNFHQRNDPGQTMSQVQNTTITFTTAGYASVTKNLADLQGTGANVLFGNSTATVTDVAVSPTTATVQVGTTFQFGSTITGTDNPPDAVTWQVTGGGPGTTISASGLLTVAADETASSLTVTATSVFDPTKSGIAMITLTSGTTPPGGGGSGSGGSGAGANTGGSADGTAPWDLLMAAAALSAGLALIASRRRKTTRH